MELKVRLCSLAVGYLLGGFLTAEIAAKVFAKKPIGKIGTGNPGMANVMANVGKKAGFFVLAVDILKTAAAMGLAWLLSGGEPRITVWYAGIGAILMLSRHYRGLARIAGGTEKKVFRKK